MLATQLLRKALTLLNSSRQFQAVVVQIVGYSPLRMKTDGFFVQRISRLQILNLNFASGADLARATHNIKTYFLLSVESLFFICFLT